MNKRENGKKVCSSVDISPAVNLQEICIVNGVFGESIESGNENKPIDTSDVGFAINRVTANGRLPLDNPNTSSSHASVSCNKASSPRLSNLLLKTPILNDSFERESYDVTHQNVNEARLPKLTSQCPQENAVDDLVQCKEPLQGKMLTICQKNCWDFFSYIAVNISIANFGMCIIFCSNRCVIHVIVLIQKSVIMGA